MQFEESKLGIWFTKLFDAFIKIGVDDSLSAEESRIVMIHNTLSLFSNVLLSYFPFVFVYLEMYEGLYLCLLSLITTIIPIFFNYQQKFILSRYFAILTAFAIFCLGLVMYDIKSGFLFGITGILVLPILYFKKLKDWLFCYGAMITMLLICNYYLQNYGTLLVDSQVPSSLHPLLFISFTLLIISFFIAVNSINKMYEKKNLLLFKTLKHRNDELKSFSYSVTHDLKQPIRNIQNFSKLLLKKGDTIAEEEKLVFINIIETNSNKLDQMVDSMFNYSMIGQSELPGIFEVNQLVNQEKEKLRDLISVSKATITSNNLSFFIKAKPKGVGQVFRNLIINAIKFTAIDKLPAIQISGKENEGYWQFAVADNGKGIPSFIHDKIFHMFQKGHSNNNLAGHGVGLANCKKIIEQHQGEIWVESVENKGSTFYFTIKK